MSNLPPPNKDKAAEKTEPADAEEVAAEDTQEAVEEADEEFIAEGDEEAYEEVPEGEDEEVVEEVVEEAPVADTRPHPAAKTARPVAAPVDPDKQKAQVILIGVIVVFLAAGLFMIPAVREAIFGADESVETVQQNSQSALNAVSPVKKKLLEKKHQPRSFYPLASYTAALGKPRAFAQEANGVKDVMYYYLFVPPQAQQARLPLVVYLHDKDGAGNGALPLLQMNKALPAYVLFLMIPKGETWAVPAKYSGEEFGKSKSGSANMVKWSTKKYPEARQSLDDVMALVANLLKIYPIDDGRIYVAGCGEGAIGVYGAAAKYGEFFAGGLVAGGLWSFLDAPQMTQTPLFILHGAKDKSIDPIAAVGMSQIITKSGGKASYYATPNETNCADNRVFGQTAWKWLFSQKKAPVQLQP